MKKTLILLILMLCLCGCGDNSQQLENSNVNSETGEVVESNTRIKTIKNNITIWILNNTSSRENVDVEYVKERYKILSDSIIEEKENSILRTYELEYVEKHKNFTINYFQSDLSFTEYQDKIYDLNVEYGKIPAGYKKSIQIY